MDIYSIVILSTIQSFTEFLPISSSGHLYIINHIYDLGSDLLFDAAIHFGTLLSIIIFFHKDVKLLISDLYKILTFKKGASLLFTNLILASIPAILIGLILITLDVHSIFRIVPLVAINLIIFGIALFIADSTLPNDVSFKDISKKDAIFIGFLQTLAFMPGVSRSGITITAGRLRGIKRTSVVKFSFLLALPTIFGSSALSLSKLNNTGLFIDAILAIFLSCILGIIVIKFFLAFIQKFSFKIFMIYRIILGIILLLLYYQ